MFVAKDFIETYEGWLFAVVSSLRETDKILCFLRYVPNQGQWKKLDTHAANRWLVLHSSRYLHYSRLLDARLHAVPVTHVAIHYQPRKRLAELLSAPGRDQVERDCQQFCALLAEQGVDLSKAGVTGSLLPGIQRPESDIDLVFYHRETFHRARGAVRALLRQGACQELAEKDWQESFRRRGCALNLSEYVWHEQRKYNKTLFHERKIDFSLVTPDPLPSGDCRKLGLTRVAARVTEDLRAFDYPAEYAIDHDEIDAVLSYTATYQGQAVSGEQIEVKGQLEQIAGGGKRLIVGSTREAEGEYIRVVHER